MTVLKSNLKEFWQDMISSIETIESYINWGRSTDEEDFYLNKGLEQESNRISKKYLVKSREIYDLLLHEVRRRNLTVF